MQSALGSSDFKTAVLLTHTLKSLSALINEEELTRLAAEAEAAFRSETRPDDVVSAMKIEFEKVSAKIKEKIKSPAAALPAPTRANTKKIFKKAKTLLQNNNAEVINIIQSLKAIPGTEKLVDEIASYNFENALKELGRLKWIQKKNGMKPQ
jgi:HPt (histidine-containing phosphotransfer) domain-containing protein